MMSYKALVLPFGESSFKHKDQKKTDKNSKLSDYFVSQKRLRIDNCSDENVGPRNNCKRQTSAALGTQPSGLNFEVVDIDHISKKSDNYDPTYAGSIAYQIKSSELTVPYTGAIFGPGSLQVELNESMRCILIDWLTEVSEEYRLQPSTFFLAVRYMDIVLRSMPLKRTQFQLLGCVCILIASKLEETHSPPIENLVFLSDYCFESDAVIKMEQKVVKLLGFHLAIPTRFSLHHRFALAADLTAKEKCLMHMFLELSLHDLYFDSEITSKVTAAALHLALQALRPQGALVWSYSLVYYTGYEENAIAHIVTKLRALHSNIEDPIYKNIVKKFDAPAYFGVSRLSCVRAEDLRFDSTAVQALYATTLRTRSVTPQLRSCI